MTASAAPAPVPVARGSGRTPEQQHADLASTLERLREGVETLSTSDGWKAWLEFAASMPNYSVNNQLLILVQRPTATAVASYTAWKSLGRQVMQGEKGLRILAPTKRAVPEVDSGTDTTVTSHEPPQDRRQQRSVRRVVTGYRPVSVFDVSQTTGAPLPEAPRPSLLAGNAPPELWDSLAAQVGQAGYRLERVGCAADIGGANGVTDFGSRTVQVRSDVSPAQAAKTLAHELGHVLLHDPATSASAPGACRDDKEVEAESVAYIVLAHAGVDASDYSFDYVAGWAAGAEPDAIRTHAQRILDASRSIISALPPDLTRRSKVSDAPRPEATPSAAAPPQRPPAMTLSR